MFKCEGCGQCCRAKVDWDFLGVKFTDDDVDRISQHLGKTTEEFRRIYHVKNEFINIAKIKACPFLVNNQCIIYAVRPAYCAAWTCNGTHKSVGDY